MTRIQTIVAALAAMGTAAAGEAESGQPLRLVVERSPGQVTLLVQGSGLASPGVSYELDVDGASTVRQRGRATLVAGQQPTVVKVTINEGAAWRAVLRVDDGRTRYEHVEQGTKS